MLEARDFVAYRGDRAVARAARIDLAEGEHLALLGPNGAGKSSLVLGLATLVRTDGELRYRGAPVRDAEAYRRRIAVVFQRPLLLDRSVRENAALGLALRGVGRREREARAETELARLGVGQLADRSAIGLSGGEAQRVSLARALAIDPEILFLDEPFSALDAPTRETLVADLARVLRERGVTTVMVTHDRDEALSLADRIGVVMNGELRQLDAAETVFGMPADPEIAAFVGVENVIPARVERATDELTFLRIADQHVEITEPPPPGDDFPLLCIRPDDVVIAREPASSSARNSFRARIVRVERATDELTFLRIADQHVEITEPPPPGDDFPLLCIRPDDVVIARAAVSSSARNSLRARIVRIEPIGRRTRLLLDCGFPLIAHVTRQSARDMGLAVDDQVIASFKATVPHLLPRIRH